MAEEGGLDRLAEEWIGLWQEEIGALAADADMMAAWRLMLGGLPGAWPGGAPREAGPAAAAVAPGPARDAAMAGDGGAAAGLLDRIAALEARLAALEAAGDEPRRPPRRKRPPT
ncbi:hypothetical protein [Belnapia moabensis]|uniref:hypothetical protein n=1 Tax=Belnapia moabensis TaxID=365533 RepID=UPI001FDF6DB3|nr:hypothetical protein [Belnapia moabensis]